MMTLAALSATVLAVVMSETLHASERDTLRRYDRKTIGAYYRAAGIDAQAARFDLAAPAFVREIVLWLGGSAVSGEATVTIYGNEAGLPAPLMSLPLTPSMVARKTVGGVQKVVLRIDEDVLLDQPQFFVVVEDLTPGVVLLSDRREKRPACVDERDEWYHQVIRRANGEWYNGKYAFAIDVMIEYPVRTPPSFLSESSEKLGLLDVPVSNSSIAWGDVDNDGWHDLLTSGRLYANRRGERFEDVTDRSGLVESSKQIAGFFIDSDADGDLDILSFARLDSATTNHALLVNDGSGRFTRLQLSLPSIHDPSAISIADADGDGRLDLFVGQLVPKGSSATGILLLNQGSNRFIERELASELQTGVTGAQWIDADDDGDPDLFTSGVAESNGAFWRNDGKANFERGALEAKVRELRDSSLGKGATADLADVDGDENLDLIQPLNLASSWIRSGRSAEAAADPTIVATPFLDGLDYRHWSGGATWSDIDNDGSLDALITSAHDCRFASLFVQERPGAFVDQSFRFGLFRAAVGTDAVWVDFDSDGRLDMATFGNNRFRLYRNNAHTQGHSIGIDLSGSRTPAAVAGSAVTVHAGGKSFRRFAVSGRGALMQAPAALHFGLGDASMVDSVTVQWSGRDQDVPLLNSAAVGTVHRVFDGDGETARSERSNELSLAVSPNPFTAYLAFTYDLPAAGRVRIELFAPDGRLIAVPLDGEQTAGPQSVTWQSLDEAGRRLPQGAYVYRLQYGERTLIGRALLVH